MPARHLGQTIGRTFNRVSKVSELEIREFNSKTPVMDKVDQVKMQMIRNLCKICIFPTELTGRSPG